MNVHISIHLAPFDPYVVYSLFKNKKCYNSLQLKRNIISNIWLWWQHGVWQILSTCGNVFSLILTEREENASIRKQRQFSTIFSYFLSSSSPPQMSRQKSDRPSANLKWCEGCSFRCSLVCRCRRLVVRVNCGSEIEKNGCPKLTILKSGRVDKNNSSNCVWTARESRVGADRRKWPPFIDNSWLFLN